MPIRQFAPSLKTWIQLLLLTSLLGGCSTQQKNTSLQHAQRAEASGDYAEIARQYNRLAADAPPAQQQAYKLMMANALFNGQYTGKAKRVLQSINESLLSGSQKFKRRILLAKIAHQENRPRSVLGYLGISIRDDTPLEQIAEYYDLRAEAHYKLGNKLAAVHERVRREPLLQNSEEIEKNQQFIWTTLLSLPKSTLQGKHTAPPPDTLSGWLELADIAEQRHQQEQKLTEWRQRYPNHPVTSAILNSIKERAALTIGQPTQIALILPLSGVYAGHATSLRDGFLAAYYAEQLHHETSTRIRIYDTQSNSDAYNTAVIDGAEFIVGPLSKKAVNTLINRAPKTLPVPTLTLNYSETTDKLPNNLYQFGLSPEDEARQIADRAWMDGHTRAIAFVPQTDWGKRTFDAFNQRWQELGGIIAEKATYASKDNDFSGPLRSILNLNESAQRKKQLNNLLQRTIKFEPRRRQDVDFVFLAASPRQARLIRPQFKFHYAADLPIYATSRVYEGTPNPAADRDMNDIIFCDTPWTLGAITPTSEVYNAATALWPQQTANKGRLYALGSDAFHVITELNRLQSAPHEQYQGETGILSMDENNQIHRKLVCARFVSGIPKVIKTSAAVPHANQQ